MDAGRVHDATERLCGMRRDGEEPGETAHRHVDTKGLQECLRRRSHAHQHRPRDTFSAVDDERVDAAVAHA